jgi:hypothetical protein
VAQYQAALRVHLARYKKSRLGVDEPGLFERTGKPYSHILPSRLRRLNLLEAIRAEFEAYRSVHPSIRLHRDFHHLNSSQALAFNLFFPYLDAGGAAASALARSMHAPAPTDQWHFEHVPDPAEGTNVDVAWRAVGGAWTLCEVKLSEGDFGATKPDARHKKKLESVYRKRLLQLVQPELLELNTFCRNYQILRNVSFLESASVSDVVFLVPSGNEALSKSFRRVEKLLNPAVRKRVHLVLLEDVLRSLCADSKLPSHLRLVAASLSEKYAPASHAAQQANGAYAPSA